MKKEYDFSKGVRGKFYRADATFHLPVYLDPDVQEFVQRIAVARRKDVGAVVNELLKSDMKLAKIMK